MLFFPGAKKVLVKSNYFIPKRISIVFFTLYIDFPIFNDLVYEHLINGTESQDRRMPTASDLNAYQHRDPRASVYNRHLFKKR